MEAVSLPKEFLGPGIGNLAKAILTFCQAELDTNHSSKRTVTPQTQSAQTEQTPQGTPTLLQSPR